MRSTTASCSHKGFSVDQPEEQAVGWSQRAHNMLKPPAPCSSADGNSISAKNTTHHIESALFPGNLLVLPFRFKCVNLLWFMDIEEL